MSRSNEMIVHEQSYEGYEIQILQGIGGRYRYFIHGHTMSEMKFQYEDSCLQEAFNWINRELDWNREEEKRAKVYKILNELKNDLSTMQSRTQQLEEIIGPPPDSIEAEE